MEESSDAIPTTDGDETTPAADVEEDDKTKIDYTAHQGIAVLGVALVSMGEDIGSDMSIRSFGHLVCVVEIPISG